MASRKIQSARFFHFLASVGAPVYVTLTGEQRVSLPSGRKATRDSFDAYYGAAYCYVGQYEHDYHRAHYELIAPPVWMWDE